MSHSRPISTPESPATCGAAVALHRVVRLRRGLKVIHAKTGWKGWVYGAGPGHSRRRWENPTVLYVDWYHRKPANSGHKLSELLLLERRQGRRLPLSVLAATADVVTLEQPNGEICHSKQPKNANEQDQ